MLTHVLSPCLVLHGLHTTNGARIRISIRVLAHAAALGSLCSGAPFVTLGFRNGTAPVRRVLTLGLMLERGNCARAQTTSNTSTQSRSPWRQCMPLPTVKNRITPVEMSRRYALVMALLALAASAEGGKPPKQSKASKDDQTAHWKLAALDMAAHEQQIREAEAARDKQSTTTVRTFTLVGDAVQVAAPDEVGAKGHPPPALSPPQRVGIGVVRQATLELACTLATPFNAASSRGR
jgi:hypothetical protein